MALDKTVLATLIKAKMEEKKTLGLDSTPGWGIDAFAEAVVEHIQTAAVVTTAVTGVTSTAVPVTGTGTGTVG